MTGLFKLIAGSGSAILIALLTFAALALYGTGPHAGGYRINPGDVLSVEVMEDPSLNRQVLVPPDGQISFPLAGSLRAGGRTVTQVQSALAAALASNFANRPTVFVGLAAIAQKEQRIIEETTLSVFVVGEAANPGQFTIAPGTTLLQLFGVMGGFTDYAATKRVQLRRTSGSQAQIFTINYKEITKGLSVDGMIPLRDGDVVLIPERRLFE